MYLNAVCSIESWPRDSVENSPKVALMEKSRSDTYASRFQGEVSIEAVEQGQVKQMSELFEFLYVEVELKQSRDLGCQK